MTDEEKEAIEFMNNIEYKQVNTDEFYDNRDILINLIEKQQKVIEELKEKNKILEELLQGRLFELYNYYKELAGKYQGNCISKDKIRKLKELVHKILDNNGITRGYQIVIDDYFDKLLGETND